MVAITVILAAVIGAFVLEIGDQQETAPNTSFESEQRTAFLSDQFGNNGCGGGWKNQDCINATVVDISHAGGETLDVTQNDATVAGNDSVWGITDMSGAEARDQDIPLGPTPDIRPSLGSNEPVEFSSGESMNVLLHGGGPVPETEGWGSNPPSDENLEAGDYTGSVVSERGGWGAYVLKMSGPRCDCHILDEMVLQQGDTVNIVWTASSGGKTQTLFKYTVQ
jgi:hypothetical protein